MRAAALFRPAARAAAPEAPTLPAPAERSISRPGLLDAAAWRDAARVWVGQHLLLLGITYFGSTLLQILSHSERRLPWSTLIASWVTWDGAIYVRIASEGYDTFWLARFFPLLPALEHVVAPLTGGGPGMAGLLISNMACLGAFGLMRILVEREAGPDVARRTLLYFALFPTAFFLVAAYAEALFVLVTVGAFLALRSGHWVVAGVLAALATLSRPVGILIVVPIAVEAILRIRATRSLPRPRGLLALAGGVALPFAALAGFSYYLSLRFGTLTAIAQSQAADGSGKGFTWPWIGFARAGHALLSYGFDPNFFQVHIVLDAAFTAALILLTILTIGRLPLPYVCYSWAVLLLLLCTPGHNWYALFSNMRFTLEVFPIFILLGSWGERRTVERLLLAASLPLLTVFTILYLLKQWVA